MRKLIITLLICIFILPVTGYAGIYGWIRGKVVDPDGKAVLGARVAVIGSPRGTIVKEKDGSFSILNINSGSYTVQITAQGYKEYKTTVLIRADTESELNVIMRMVEFKTDSVVVTSERLVNNSQIGTMRRFDSNLLTNVSSESVQAIVGLSAGVLAGGNGYNIRGSRPSESKIHVDGLDVGDQFSGGFGIGGLTYYPMVSAYATEEVQVLTGGFSAEYGDAMGGIVNQVVRTGRTDRYDGFLRWRTDVDALWGSQDHGLKLVQEPQKFVPVNSGPGYKLQGPNEHKIEFGFGGPLPILNNTTFYLSTSYMNEEFRNNSYDIKDPAGNNLGRLPNNQTWVKNITGRVKLGVTNNIFLILGGMYGLSTFETSSSAWLYSNDPGLVFEKNYDNNGKFTGFSKVIDPKTGLQKTNGIPERIAKQAVANQFATNAMVRINHNFENSFYEITLSNSANNDEYAKRIGYEDPNFFTGYNIIQPQDNFTVERESMVVGHNSIIDPYEIISIQGWTKDGYTAIPIFGVNPLTGYIEGAADASGTDNPYGRTNVSYSHGNQNIFQFRKSNYWQLDGHYDLNLEYGEFKHMMKMGGKIQLFELRYHSNSMPWDGNPFFDVYTDEWGGNLYTDDSTVKKETSKPYKPFKGDLYIQDQITYKGIIISPGLRLDFFAPQSDYRTERAVFVSIKSDTGFGSSSFKYQISPRINVTYPLTERSNFSIAYGLYFKMPEMTTLYDAFAKDILRGNEILGDPNIDAQRTNQYQVSYNNSLTEMFALDIQAYYKDIYNQVGMVFVPAVPTPYYQYSVAEYGNARGLEITLRKNPSATDHLQMSINYALSSARGTSSSPTSNYLQPIDYYTGSQAFPLAEYPMSWDRTHRINAIINFIWNNDQGPSIGGIQPLENVVAAFTTVFQTGTPYTRTDLQGRPISEANAERQPSYWVTNLRLTKEFYLRDWFGGMGNSAIQFFVDVYNLFNRTAATAYYSRTGDPIDDGVTLIRKAGDFSLTPYYKEANFALPETFRSEQYDNFGNRLYNVNADTDLNEIVTQEEKFHAYMKQVETSLSFRGNFQGPRTFYAGIMFRF